MPKPGDGYVDVNGGNGMSGHVPDCDLSNDCLELLLEEQMAGMDHMMMEGNANIEGAASIVRFSAARKFNELDPLEGAAADMILQRNV